LLAVNFVPSMGVPLRVIKQLTILYFELMISSQFSFI
jgi:hypothetical protein